MKITSILLATCAVGLISMQGHIPSFSFAQAPSPDRMSTSTQDQRPSKENITIEDVKAGHYLASRHAQIHHDWNNASQFLGTLIQSGIAPDEILQRAMVLAIGSGDVEQAIILAEQTKEKSPDGHNTIADILIFVDAVKHDNFKKAQNILAAMPNDNTIRFISPFLNGWVQAANGKSAIKDLQHNTAQLYHGILISDYLGHHDEIENIIDRATRVEDITASELERIADLYGHVGMKDKAITLYKRALEIEPKNESLENKILSLKNGKTKPLFEKIKTPRQGIAQSFYDISKLLYNESNDETARVFAQIAHHLYPDMSNSILLLAEINARNKQYARAIEFYKSIPKDDENYLTSRYSIADLYSEREDYDSALKTLSDISSKDYTADVLIKIGDLQRAQSNFGLALKSYNDAIEKLGGTISEEYWHLHYVLGISYEQADNWKRAEEELQAALKFQPDHPYVLNYLGYAWADKGIHLDKALDMIQKAVNLRPSDGYITDSLGWVMYKIKDYQNSVLTLERAVELLPYDPTINDHLGDAYWKVGRILEAKFQWERARNHSEDQKQIQSIEEKLTSGLTDE